MKTLKERVEKYIEETYANGIVYFHEEAAKAFQKGFIDATKLAAEKAEVRDVGTMFQSWEVDKQSILKAIEE